MLQEFIEQFYIEKYEELNDGIYKYYLSKNIIKKAIKQLKNLPEYDFSMLLFIAAADNGAEFELTYHLYSVNSNKHIVLACDVMYDSPVVETVSDIYKSSDWEEREIFDLFGIDFISHKNMKRLLMPKDWKGYPLRKNYTNNDKRLAWNK